MYKIFSLLENIWYSAGRYLYMDNLLSERHELIPVIHHTFLNTNSIKYHMVLTYCFFRKQNPLFEKLNTVLITNDVWGYKGDYKRYDATLAGTAGDMYHICIDKSEIFRWLVSNHHPLDSI
jgi:hypothetical protein